MNCDHGVNAKHCRVCKKAKDEGDLNKMTDVQLGNWRNALVGEFGPVALLMPRDLIIKIAKRLQAEINKEVGL